MDASAVFFGLLSSLSYEYVGTITSEQFEVDGLILSQIGAANCYESQKEMLRVVLHIALARITLD